MSRLILGVMLVLSACIAAPVAVVPAFRPAKAPIYSAAAFVPARMEGTWQQAAAFAVANEPGCPAGGVRFDLAGDSLSAEGRLCLNGRQVQISGPLAVTGPGRLTLSGMPEWWVLWVDSDYRTLAVGTPDGRFGFVLDRGRIGADRLSAAAEILEFNGYQKARLRPF